MHVLQLKVKYMHEKKINTIRISTVVKNNCNIKCRIYRLRQYLSSQHAHHGKPKHVLHFRMESDDCNRKNILD